MGSVDSIFALALKLSLVLFVAGSLLEMGLGLGLRECLAGLRNRRFLGYGLLFGFILRPLLAWMLILILPIERPYAIGLMLLAMTPCAPFLPMMVKRAKGDMTHAPAMLLLAAIGTVILLPLGTPWIVSGLAVDRLTIAMLLLILVLLPLLAGMVIHRTMPSLAARIRPVVKTVAAAAAVMLLVFCIILYGRGFWDSLGSFAIGTQVLFIGLITAGSYGLARGLPKTQRSVLGLGMCTCNVGAALAPLLAGAELDERIIVMVTLAVPVQILCSLVAAHLFARDVRHPPPEGGVLYRSG